MMRRAAMLLLSACLCAPAFADDNAWLKIYRPAEPEARDTAPALEINGQRIGDLAIGSSYAVKLRPGASDITVRENLLGFRLFPLAEMSVDLDPGEVRYLKFQTLEPIVMVRRGKRDEQLRVSLEQVDREEGRVAFEAANAKQRKNVETPEVVTEEDEDVFEGRDHGPRRP